MTSHDSEISTGEKVIILARQLHRLDTFFSYHSQSQSIKNFLDQNRFVVYEELSYRLQTGHIKENFGTFEPLLESALAYLTETQEHSSEAEIHAGTMFDLQKLLHKVKKVKEYKKGVDILLKVVKEHGMYWIPPEFKRVITFSFLALPIMFISYESMRVSMIAALVGTNIEEFSSFIFGLYIVVAALGFIQEQKTLQHTDAIVFNPYSNLFALGLSPLMSGLASRIPRHTFELSAIVSAIAVQKEVSSSVLAPVLSAVVAAMVWSSMDIVFNYTQQKIWERKESDTVYNLG